MKGHLIWLLGQTSIGQRLLSARFCGVGLAMIAVGLLTCGLWWHKEGAGVDMGVLAFWVAVGLFWIVMAFIHALISVVRGRL